MALFPNTSSPQKNAAPLQSFVKKSGTGQLPNPALAQGNPNVPRPGSQSDSYRSAGGPQGGLSDSFFRLGSGGVGPEVMFDPVFTYLTGIGAK